MLVEDQAVMRLGGPLTHLSDAVDRETAMTELVRVVKPGGAVCISVMGYLGMLGTVLIKSSDELVDPFFWERLRQGNNQVGSMQWHFFRAEEIKELAEGCGLTTLAMAGCQGLSSGLAETANRLAQEEAKWSRWIELVLETSAEAAVVDMAEHILYIGRA